jgi:putative oxidoreductase
VKPFEAIVGKLRTAHSQRRSVDLAALVLRGALGVVFFAHGAQKVLGWFGGTGIAGATKSLNSAGIPASHFFAYVVSLTELVGGLLLLAGLLTVVASLALTIDMLVAILAVTHKAGFFVTSRPGWELNLDLIAMAVALLVMGPGAWSMDRLLGLTRKHLSSPRPASEVEQSRAAVYTSG